MPPRLLPVRPYPLSGFPAPGAGAGNATTRPLGLKLYLLTAPDGMPITWCLAAQAPREEFRRQARRTRRYHIPPEAARTIAALLALRDQVIAPILAGVRSPRRGRKPTHWTTIDRHYETLRIGMQDLFRDLGITPTAVAA